MIETSRATGLSRPPLRLIPGRKHGSPAAKKRLRLFRKRRGLTVVPATVRLRSRHTAPMLRTARKQPGKQAHVLRWALGLYIVFLIVFVGSVLWLSHDMRELRHELDASSSYPGDAPNSGAPPYPRAQS